MVVSPCHVASYQGESVCTSSPDKAASHPMPVNLSGHRHDDGHKAVSLLSPRVALSYFVQEALGQVRILQLRPSTHVI